MPIPLPSYPEALAWLFGRTRAGGARGPDRAAALLAAWGLTAPPLVVHVVGTNGKGTVTTMIAAGLQAAGHRTGRFVSPHVEEFRERIAVDGAPVSRVAVRRFVAEAMRWSAAQAPAPERQPAFFEWSLALALRTFADAGATAAVLEAGVGGASDATRAVEPVRLVVLTNVDLDHLDTLGTTLQAIARDKAGAFRPGVPAVTGARGEALAVVADAAVRLGAPLFVDPAARPPGSAITPEEERRFALPVGLALDRAGTRADNARLAAAAMRLLGLDERAVAVGLRAPPLPARGERFRVRGRTVILDGAHDPAAAARLASELASDRDEPYVLLFGALRRKAGPAMLPLLAARAQHVVLTEAAPGDGVPAAPTGAAADAVSVEADPDAALAVALQRCPEGGRVVIAGSLYLAGRLRPWLRRHGRRLAPSTEAPPTAPSAAGLLDSRTA